MKKSNAVGDEKKLPPKMIIHIIIVTVGVFDSNYQI